MKKLLAMVFVLCFCLVGCNNGVIESVETLGDSGSKSAISNDITYMLHNVIVLKDDKLTIEKNREDYIFDHAKEIGDVGKIKDRDISVADIVSSDGEYIGSYMFENKDGIIEYEFKFYDETFIYNKLTP